MPVTYGFATNRFLSRNGSNGMTGPLGLVALTTAQRDALDSPAEGDTVFNTTTGAINAYNGSSWVAGSGASDFLSLSDTPSDYSGQATKTLVVNAGEDALEFAAAGAGDLVAANNLSDVDTAATALSNIGGIGAATTDTLTNKTFDANGTGNSLSNVDVADLANGTDGELITWDADGASATVAAGTADQVLTSNGAGAAPTFQDATGGTDPADGWTFNEDAIALLDAALSADGKYNGYGQVGTAGTNLAFGQVAYYAAADSKWELTDADASATAGPVKIGIVAVAGNEDASVTLMYRGVIREDDWNWGTIGAPVYLDTATAGGMTQTAPSGSGDIVRIVGYAKTADSIWFEPDTSFVELD